MADHVYNVANAAFDAATHAWVDPRLLDPRKRTEPHGAWWTSASRHLWNVEALDHLARDPDD